MKSKAVAKDKFAWKRQNLKRAIEAAGVTLWSWNVDTDALALDEHAYDLWGIERGVDVCFEDLSAHIHPSCRPRPRSGRICCNTRNSRAVRNRLPHHDRR